MTDERTREVQDAWNRFGQYMEAWAGYSGRVWSRQQELWASIAKNLSSGQYSADTAASDAVLAMAVMQRNAEDGWRVLTGPPGTERAVSVLPTAFLFFDLSDPESFPLADAVDIPVPPDIDRDDLPERAFIALNGTSVSPREAAEPGGAPSADASVEGVRALEQTLRATFEPAKGVYSLEPVAESATRLVRGVYDGLVYLTKPAVPLANVRIIVGPPPAV